jgi:hypothetical protein
MDNKTHIIQSVLIDKNEYDLIDALLYILKNNYKANKIDESNNYFRFRQVEPVILDNKGFNRYKTIKGIEEGTKFIIAYK